MRIHLDNYHWLHLFHVLAHASILLFMFFRPANKNDEQQRDATVESAVNAPCCRQLDQMAEDILSYRETAMGVPVYQNTHMKEFYQW